MSGRPEPEVVFTRHAESKFDILKQHGFRVTRAQVVDALLKPDNVFPAEKERWVAQKAMSEHHVLRIVYRREGDVLVVITFYPGRRKYYESSI